MRGTKSKKMAGVLLISALIVTGPLAETQLSFDGQEKRQRMYNHAEFAQLQAMSEYVQSGEDVNSFWLTQATLRTFFGVHRAGKGGLTVSNNSVQSQGGLVVVREAWSDHLVYYSHSNQQRLGELLVSKDIIHQWKTMENKVYASGQVSVLNNPNDESTILG